MGLFKDVRALKKQAKDLQAQTGTKRPSLREGLSMANAAMSDVSDQLAVQQHLQANGTRVYAMVDAVRPTTMLVNHMPVVEYDLRMNLGDREVSITHRQATPQVYLASATVGATLNALVDTADPDKVLLLFG